MTEYADVENDKDEHRLKWRSVSRKLITELNEKIYKRHSSLSQCSPTDEFSQFTSDEEGTSASSRLCDEYHRKKISDAEFKFKMLEGFDTLSESSSVSSSFCLQEFEVQEETDEKTSITENINSHNSGGDGRSDSKSPSYSTSFSESIEEDIEVSTASNGDSSSTSTNAASSPISRNTTESDAENVQPGQCTDTPRKNTQKSKEGPDDEKMSLSFEQEGNNHVNNTHWLQTNENELLDSRKNNEDVSFNNDDDDSGQNSPNKEIRTCRDLPGDSIETWPHASLQDGDRESQKSDLFKFRVDSDKGKTPIIADHEEDIGNEEDRKTQQSEHAAEQASKPSTIDAITTESPYKNAKQLHGFDDIHELFIEQVCEVTLQHSISDAVMEKTSNNMEPMVPECGDQYMPTLNHLCLKESSFSNILSEGCKNCTTESSPPKKMISNQCPFQNLSCNNGPCNKNCRAHVKSSIATSSSTRRQAMLKDTLNRPLQFCIEKARLVTSIRESIEKARTIKDILAGRAAYDKAIKEFTYAVDKLLVDQDNDDSSLNDNTYSLDDAKLIKKQAPNPLDALRTPVNKRRMATRPEELRKANIALCDNDSKIMSHHQSNKTVKPHDMPGLQRTSTFLVCSPKSNKQTPNNRDADTKNPVMLKKREKTFKRHVIFNEDDPDTYSVRDAVDTARGELSTSLTGTNDNDDTAYVSDLSPPAENNKTYMEGNYRDGCDGDMIALTIPALREGKGNRNLGGENDDETFCVNLNDKTFPLRALNNDLCEGIEEQNTKEMHCQLSDDETLNIPDSFGNAENDSVNLDDLIPGEGDINSMSTSHTSIDEPFFDVHVSNDSEDFPHKTVLETNSDYFIQFTQGEVYDQKKDLPATEHFVSNVEKSNNNEAPKGTKNRELTESVNGVSGRCMIKKYEKNGFNKKRKRKTREKKTSQILDVSPFMLRGQTDELKSLRSWTEEIIDDEQCFQSKTTDNVNMITENEFNAETGAGSKKQQAKSHQLSKSKTKVNEVQHLNSGVSQKESTASLCSSTSGEYSLLNPMAKALTEEIAPFSNTCSKHAESKPLQDLEQSERVQCLAPKHPPSEMLIREKSAVNIEEVCVKNLEIFHQLEEIPSACLKKIEDDITKEETSQEITFEYSDNIFENSMYDLRKTAIGCLGPLREKVAFFENIERALQGNETILQSMNGDSRWNHSEELNEYASDRKYSDRKTSPKRHAPTEELMDAAVFPQHVESQSAGTISASITRHTGTLSQDGLSDLVNLVDELKRKVSNTNELCAKLKVSFEEAMQTTHQERERITGGLDLLSRRIDSNEAVILEKISSVENDVLSATHVTGSRFLKMKESIDKLRCDNAEHFDSLEQFLSHGVIQKEDLDALENKVTSGFKEHIHRVYTALNKFQELKPSQSSASPPQCQIKRNLQSGIEDMRMKLIEMKNQRDAEKMYHKITRESMRALERDHDRLRQEILLSATRRHLMERRKSSKIHSLTENILDSKMADIEVPSTPRKCPELVSIEVQKPKTGNENSSTGGNGRRSEKSTTSGPSDCVKKKEKKPKK